LASRVAHSSDAICPFSFDRGAPLEVEAKLCEELNGGIDVFYHDTDVVHAFDGHNCLPGDNMISTAQRRTVEIRAADEEINRIFGCMSIRSSIVRLLAEP